MSAEYLDNLPTVLPVTVADLKAHLRLDSDDTSEDDLLEQYIFAAVQEAEHYMQREIVQRADTMAICEDAADVPQSIKQYLLAEAGFIYNHRESQGTDNLHRYHEHLLDGYRLFYRGEEA